MEADPVKFLTIEQVCGCLSVTKTTVYNLVALGKLPAYRIGPRGGSLRVSMDDLNAYLESVRTGPPAAPKTAPYVLQTLRPRRLGRRKKAKEGE